LSSFKLISTSGEQTIEVAPGRRIVVGRAATSDVPIYDPTISRRHAEVALANGGVQVKDLGSSNGTFVNGARVTDTVASVGDVVTFGKVAFRVREVTPPTAQPAVENAVSTFGSQPPPGATIVRNVEVPEDVNKRVSRASGASHLKVAGESADERQARKLSLLLDISKELSKQQEVDKLLDKVVDITFQVMSVDRVSILMVEGETAELVPRISKNRLGDVAGSVTCRNRSRGAR